MHGFPRLEKHPTPDEISHLFNNNDPKIVWAEATDIVRRISPGYDFILVQSVYEDVLRLFRGEYPGYGPVKTPYHDLYHTLEVLLCGLRLMHGVHVSGDHMADDEITSVMLATLLHDVGYAQRRGEESGTGAQYTQTHVPRSVEFMRRYFTERKPYPGLADSLHDLISGTEDTGVFSRHGFSDDRIYMLGQIVTTADLVGQMADRNYLEKLLFLYLEFREARFGNYQSMYDLLCKTKQFYEKVREKLDGPLGGIYKKLEFHFKDTMGVGNNYYLEAIEKNMAYLAKIIAHDEAELLTMLKRNGIAKRIQALIAPV